ncbi:hypothetical protein OSTOST_24840, partial [Ostertagia ostertagi]
SVRDEEEEPQQRYNLRPRKQINYGNNPIQLARQVPLVSLILAILGFVGLQVPQVQNSLTLYAVYQVDFCSAVIFNPECWPVGAILAAALMIYFVITGCYVFLYVPLVVGSPVRILAGVALRGICHIVGVVLRRLGNIGQRRRRRKPADLVELLAVASLIVCQYKCGESCQQVDLFSHTSTVCENTLNGNTASHSISKREIFRCNRWRETAKVKFTHTDIRQKKTQSYTAFMIPYVPIKWNSFTLTLSLVKSAPTPLLNTPFITDGNSTAIWNPQLTPLLECQNRSQAQTFDCNIANKCVCYPAETQANCNCENLNISAWIHDLRHRLPLVFPSVIFKRDREGQVHATIPSMTTAEIIMTMQGNLETDILVDEATCSISNTSSLRFSFDTARIHQKCRASCGQSVTIFEIGGLLKYPHTASNMVDRWLRGETSSEPVGFHWPDFPHILDVFLMWYKTLLSAVLALLVCREYPHMEYESRNGS